MLNQKIWNTMVQRKIIEELKIKISIWVRMASENTIWATWKKYSSMFFVIIIYCKN
jgi:hypothetical protein